MIDLLSSVFLWASVPAGAMLAVIVAFHFESEPRTTEKKALGFLVILLFEVPRFAMPFLPQPGLGIPRMIAWPLGGALFALAMGFAGLAATRLGPAVADAPSKDEELQTSGVYGLVRHPIYFGDAFWPVGWSILFGAAYSLALTPLWFALLLVQSSLEERKLVGEHGEAYEHYKEHVPYRIIPKVV
ncbi:hypothetical protein AKJ36_00170 [candidate division MSBL1 archaeon SCGC-AAA259I07]|uniref:Steroid 5-alpha reductase C-terminal domain-containing protein n=1 Tax=candidate division MSBL1 archaeon SCGC-AAA259I07 TaxID=1698266 RepID=A0A133UMZ6_9EURY|nr:hypothetical protein AKJ36_00170 [candidate division MSBL1 archaeon SCGC-AAA259I07]